MSVPFNDGAGVAAPRFWDLRQGKIDGTTGRSIPYDSRAEALASIPLSRRCEGLKVLIKNGDGIIQDYHFEGGYADGDLKQMTMLPPGPIITTRSALNTLAETDSLIPSTDYIIPDGDGGVFNLNAISSRKVNAYGFRTMKVPATYAIVTDDRGNIWKGIWHEEGTFAVGNLAIWGAYVWKNLTGAAGSATDDFTLDSDNWQLIAKTGFSNGEYIDMTFMVAYDLVNDWILSQSDFLNNVVACPKNIADTYSLAKNPVDTTDWNWASNGLASMYNNVVSFGIRNNRTGDIYNNVVTQGPISGNGTGAEDAFTQFIGTNTSVYGITNNKMTAQIEQNHANTIDANANTGSILGNWASNINGNTNGGSITYNIAIDISSNSNAGDINSNACTAGIGSNSNAGAIQYNRCNQINGNAINGTIEHNNPTGDITGNFSTVVCNIHHNNNNGDIFSGSERTGDVTSTIVTR